MKTIRNLFHRAVLAILAVLPGRSAVAHTPETDEDNRIRQKDDRLDVAVRKTRMWASVFPNLTSEQRADPNIHAIMPWAGRGNFHKMAELTKEQWDPITIKNKAEARRATP